MPWKIIKRNCKQSNDGKGKYVIVKIKSKNSTEQVSCHTSKNKAKSAIKAKYANEGKKMKITKRQLRRIIKEEKAKLLSEGAMGDLEMELIEDIVSLLARNGVIRPDADNSYDEALYWVEAALIPALQDMVDAQAGRNPGGSIG